MVSFEFRVKLGGKTDRDLNLLERRIGEHVIDQVTVPRVYLAILEHSCERCNIEGYLSSTSSLHPDNSQLSA